MMKTRFLAVAVMIAAAAATRLLPHPPNFAPIAAMALFGGARFDRRLWAFLVPLAAMFLSDAALEAAFGWGFHGLLPAVYLSFVAIVGLGIWLRRRLSVGTVAGATLAASTLFFVTTNFAVWATSPVYPRSFDGLVACYVAGIPFFGYSLAGDAFYVSALFGLFYLAQRRFEVLRTSAVNSAEGIIVS